MAASYVTGFLIWLAIGLAAGVIARVTYSAEETTTTLSLLFAVFGAFVGGMLGVSPYVYNAPTPLRVGGLIGAVLGGLFFVYLYHFTARKAV